MKKKIAYKTKVDLHYSISNKDNVVFESTFDKKPIHLQIGDGTIPQKLEITLYGLCEHDIQEIELQPKDAFGVRNDKKVQTLAKKDFPSDKMIKINNVLEVDVKQNDGKVTSTFAIIKEIEKDQVMLDLNHPLAGITIKFKAEIVKIYE
tara:strand:+ start:1371 stop:1817 length:447 start_codon:yes stop_codon:yes gene_type:complete